MQSDKLHRCPVARVSHIRPRYFVRRGGLFSTVRAASLSECVRPFRTTSAHVKATTIPFDKQQTCTNVHPLAFARPSRAPLVFINLKVLSAKRLRRSRMLSLAIVHQCAKIKGQTHGKSEAPANPFCVFHRIKCEFFVKCEYLITQIGSGK